MARGRGFKAVRAWATFGGLTGMAMLVAPARIATLTAGAGRPPSPVIVRILGARQVVQALIVVAHPTTGPIRAGAAVDMLHAASMVGAAFLLPAYRRSAAMSAAAAGASGATGLLVGRRGT